MARKKKTVRRSKSSTRKPAARSRTAASTAKRRTRRTAKPATAAAKTAPARRRAGSGSGDAATLSLTELQAEIASRVAALETRKAELLAEVAEIDAALASAGGPVSAPSGRRRGTRSTNGKAPASTRTKTGRRGGRRKGVGGKSLAESLHDVLVGKEMKVSELVEAVRAAGYASDSPNFRIMVSAALSKNKGTMFKNIRRGVYTAI